MVAPGQEGSVITILSRTVVVFIVMGSHRKTLFSGYFPKMDNFNGF